MRKDDFIVMAVFGLTILTVLILTVSFIFWLSPEECRMRKRTQEISCPRLHEELKELRLEIQELRERIK